MYSNNLVTCPYFCVDLGIELCHCEDSKQYCGLECPDMKEIIDQVYEHMISGHSSPQYCFESSQWHNSIPKSTQK